MSILIETSYVCSMPQGVKALWPRREGGERVKASFFQRPWSQDPVASLGGGGKRLAPGVTILGWHHIIMWNYNSTDLWWIPYFFHFVWSSPSSFRLKIHWFLDEDPFFWSSHTFESKTHLFCSGDLFFLVFPYFWYEKGCHHKIPPRVPPFLATTLARSLFNSHPGHVVASLDKTHYDDYLCLEASNKQQMYTERSQSESLGYEDSSEIKMSPPLPRGGGWSWINQICNFSPSFQLNLESTVKSWFSRLRLELFMN